MNVSFKWKRHILPQNYTLKSHRNHQPVNRVDKNNTLEFKAFVFVFYSRINANFKLFSNLLSE